MVDSIWAAANATELTVPDLGSFIWQTHHEDMQVKFQENTFHHFMARKTLNPLR